MPLRSSRQSSMLTATPHSSSRADTSSASSAPRRLPRPSPEPCPRPSSPPTALADLCASRRAARRYADNKRVVDLIGGAPSGLLAMLTEECIFPKGSDAGYLEKVNKAFEETFSRLFNGGSAHLELIDAEDPLNAGLEIYAQPPGKKLTSLALMSGGEQSMTATALIFALLQTNPAPICVLDEVDAPLDDHNVARFCDLVSEWARKSQTRIVIVTHHPVTMSRVDRLFGVTGKVVVVTGGSKGIGLMLAAGFVQNGAKVYIFSRKPALDAAAALTALPGPGSCVALQCGKSPPHTHTDSAHAL